MAVNTKQLFNDNSRYKCKKICNRRRESMGGKMMAISHFQKKPSVCMPIIVAAQVVCEDTNHGLVKITDDVYKIPKVIKFTVNK